MENLVEFNVVVYLNDEKQQREKEKYAEMGVVMPPEEQEERIVKYAFDCSEILEVRETFVSYKGEWKDAVVAIFSEKNFETPPLLTTYQEFKRKVNEHNKKASKT